MTGLLPGYEKCFFCGPATGGLGLEIQCNDGTVFCDFTAREKFQGYDGMLHGGIVTGVLDEVMWWALFVETKMVFATWKLDVEFRRPVLCGKAYRASAQFLSHLHRTYYVSGVIEDESGNVCARAKGSFRKTRQIALEEITRYLDFRGVPREIRSFLHPPETSD
jgi:uncharacterized protein (TIGR00369 family)